MEAMEFGSVTDEDLQALPAFRGQQPTAAPNPLGAGDEMDDMTMDDAVPEVVVADDRFRVTGVAASVTEGGCPVSTASTFSAPSQVYLTFRAFGLPSGTELSVAWSSGGEIRAQDTWTTTQAFDNACLWFLLDNSFVAISPGDWRVTLFVGGEPVAEPVTFRVE
jgi:hypothetical protein